MNEIVTSIEQSKRHDIIQPNITLTPVQGLPDIFVDMDAMEVFSNKGGGLRRLSVRYPFGKVSLHVNGKTITTTIYRLVWAAQKGIDYNKIPTEYCFSWDGKKITVHTRAGINAKSAAIRKENSRIVIENAQKELDLIKGYNLDHRKKKELYQTIISYRGATTEWMKYTFGLCDERAELYAEQAEGILIEQIKEGCAKIGFSRSLKQKASSLYRNDRCRRIEYYDNGKPKPINANYF